MAPETECADFSGGNFSQNQSEVLSLDKVITGGQSQHLMDARAGDSENDVARGILTDRLTSRHLRIWGSIRKIVFARNRSSRIIHPKLRALWNEAETSGHVIYIELSDIMSLSRAGQFMIEKLDPMGQRHTAVIRINLSIINLVYVGQSARRADGLIPFAGLRSEERYAEVLGHELAHAVRTFQDAGHLKLSLELDQEIKQLNFGPRGLVDESGNQERWDRIARLSRRIEQPAEAQETDIWHELLIRRSE